MPTLLRPCGLKVDTCDLVCSMDEWIRCADHKVIPQRIKDRIKKQKEQKG